jgi:hypothetical protein
MTAASPGALAASVTPADLLVLWAWEYDAEFVQILKRTCAEANVSAAFVDADGMSTVARALQQGELAARCVLDRVWDWGEEYEAHVSAVEQLVPHKINDYALVRQIWNKPHIHYMLMKHGINVPHTHILPAVDQQHDVQPIDLSHLKGCFSVKGAHSGGSGVLRPAQTWDDIVQRRFEWRSDQTMIQEWVEPRLLGKRRAWFRVFYACGVAYPCWQDDRNHIQQLVLPEEERVFKLDALRSLTQHIAAICGLNLFSTEIALDAGNRWVVVDYVNDPCDYRPNSTVTNGVPDEIVCSVAARIAAWARKRARSAT